MKQGTQVYKSPMKDAPRLRPGPGPAVTSNGQVTWSTRDLLVQDSSVREIRPAKPARCPKKDSKERGDDN